MDCPEMSDEQATFVIVGGGISGVSCAELLPFLCPEESIILISASPLVKAATRIVQVTPMLEDFDVEEKPADELLVGRPNLKVVLSKAVKLDTSKQIVFTADNRKITYKKLCIATGGKPKLIAEDNPCIIGIRDTETVRVFQQKLTDARRIMVVGNGGIATELVYEIEGCQVIWAIKDASISATFFDPGAGEFFVPHLGVDKEKSDKPLKRHKYTVQDPSEHQSSEVGSALGPDWATGLNMSSGAGDYSHNVQVQYKSELKRVLTVDEFRASGLQLTSTSNDILDDENITWPVYVELTNECVFGCDFIVSATGVVPNSQAFLGNNLFDVAEDSAIKVDSSMKTNIPNVFAAGDVCSVGWEVAKHWFQMRLWTQARQMGAYVAKCMIGDLRGEEVTMDFCFELFTHVTKFFGYKVVLLGLFNGQKLGKDYDILLRCTKGMEYVKVILQNGRMQGAILVGETDLEETFENLILNQMDLSPYKEDLLNPDIDIEDYFD